MVTAGLLQQIFRIGSWKQGRFVLNSNGVRSNQAWLERPQE